MTAEDTLRGILRDCSAKGWDSYGAEPITEEVAQRARRVLVTLHERYTFAIIPCSDGGIVFEGTGEWDGVDIKVEP